MLAVLLVQASSALAWSNHTLATWQALEGMPELQGDAARGQTQPQASAETLESFLAAEDQALERVLAAEEDWARTHVPQYPSRPDAIRWQAGGAASSARARFMAALRINPATPLPLFVQRLPGQPVNETQRLPWTAVTTLYSLSTRAAPFVRLDPGEAVSVQAILASAADEPDYGMDIGLWEDNGTPHGQAYGFGKQPFGNAALDFATQAPFHMGFYHEAKLTYALAGFLARTYPEYRIHLFQTLARHALASGHTYWGWRFAGWALHYIGDLTQPYHARVLPGVSLSGMIWIEGLDKLGATAGKREAITLVSNRHLALEYYQYFRLYQALREGRQDDALLAALRDTARDGETRYRDDAPRQVITAESVAQADRLDATLEASFPGRYTRDASYDVGADKNLPDLYGVVRQSPAAEQQALEKVTADQLGRFGTHTRAFVRSLLR